MLLLAAPAMADVFIVCTPGPGPNDVTVSFSSSGEAELVRAIALDVQISDPNAWVEDVNCVSEGYIIHPTNIVIGVGGHVEEYGSCAGVLDMNLVISEQASAYIGAANEPAEGDLFIVTLGGCTLENPSEVTVTVSENQLRGGVVMEDANNPTTVNLTGASASFLIGECPVSDICAICRGDVNDTVGSGPPDGTINFGDLMAIYNGMTAVYPTGDPTFVFDIGCPFE